MAIKGLFKVVQSVDFANETSVVKVRTQAGLQAAMRRGPFLYGFVVTLPDCIQHSTQHSDLLDQLADSDYGTEQFQSSLPARVTRNRGSWDTTPGTPKVAEVTNGNTVDCDGAPNSITGYARKLDWVQFTGDKKVYQIMKDVDTSSTGTFTLTLNTPLVKPSVNDKDLIIGEDVEFNITLDKIPQERILKLDGSDNQIRFRKISAREVVE